MQKFFFFDNAARRFLSVRDGFVFGRNEGDQCYPKDALMSRRHCRIIVIKDSVYIEDLDSTNHTKVNSQLIQSHTKRRLQLNDVVEFGAQRLILTNQSKFTPGNIEEAGANRGKFKGLRTESGSLTSQISRIITKQTQVLLNLDEFVKLGAKEFFRPWTWDFSTWLALAGMVAAGGFWYAISAKEGALSPGLAHAPADLCLKAGLVLALPTAATLFVHYIFARRLGRKRWLAKLPLLAASLGVFALAAASLAFVSGLGDDVEENATLEHCVNHLVVKACRPYARRDRPGFARLPHDLQDRIISRLVGE